MFVCSVVVHSNKQGTTDDDMMMILLLLLLLLPRLRVSTKHTTYCRSKVRFFFSECEKKERKKKVGGGETKKQNAEKLRKKNQPETRSWLFGRAHWSSAHHDWQKNVVERRKIRKIFGNRAGRHEEKQRKERGIEHHRLPACLYSRARTQNKTKTHNNASQAGGHITRQEWPIPVLRNGRIPTAESSGSSWP